MEVLQKQPLPGKVELFALVSTLINTSGFLIILIIEGLRFHLNRLLLF